MVGKDKLSGSLKRAFRNGIYIVHQTKSKHIEDKKAQSEIHHGNKLLLKDEN